MKKIFAVFIAVSMVLFMGACGQSSSSSEPVVEAVAEEEKEKAEKTADEKTAKEFVDILDLNVGDIFSFGYYGNEAIEWRILDISDGKALVISENGIDAKPYNENKYEDFSWATCTLRQWLNSSFINEVFSEQEQNAICVTRVAAGINPVYDTNPGNDTEDKFFLLSIDEAGKYFSSDEDRMCTPTEYAISQGASQGVYASGSYKTASGEDTCYWWLRSPGGGSFYTADVFLDGSLQNTFGADADSTYHCVRPAFWLDLVYRDTSTLESPEYETIVFGKYEQDNDYENGVEGIEWIVLDNFGDDILIVSRYAIDILPYNDDGSDTSWNTCSLQYWLNNDFLGLAFNNDELDRIDKVTIDNLECRIFLLSTDEVTKYFGDNVLLIS